MNFSSIDWVDLLVKVGIVVLILLVTWILARLVKTAIEKLMTRVPAVQRQGEDGVQLSKSVGTIASLLVWLFGLVAVLNVFNLEGVLTPITGMLGSVLAYLPNLIGAAFVFFIGLLIARIVRQLVETALTSLNLGKYLRAGAGRVESITGTGDGVVEGPRDTEQGRRLASAIGAVVFALIMIVVTIAALEILGIAAISGPATQMLTAIINAIPNILAAGIILALGVFIAKVAGDLLGQILGGVGVDKALRDTEVLPADRSAVPTIVKVVQVAIVLFFAVMAADMLGFPQIQAFLTEVLALGGRVLFGGAIIAVGFWIANLITRLMSGGVAAAVVRWATVALFIAMGLSFMGIADSIVELAFGAVVVGGALAAALAFGLGGRNAAARLLDKAATKVEQHADRDDATSPSI